MISVVTITFNNTSELIETLATLKSAGGIESVVVNGGSCNKAKELLYKNKIKSISEKDYGISDAFNKGLFLSSCESITFLNSGDFLIDSTYYERADEILVKNPEIDFIYADIIFVHKSSGEHIVKPGDIRIGDMPFPHPSLIVRRRVFEEIGTFDKNYKLAMDYEFVYRMIKHGCKGYYLLGAPVVKMIGDGVSSSNGKEGLRERAKALKSNDLWSFKRKRKNLELYIKHIVRELLDSFHLLEQYDKLKKIKKLKKKGDK